MAEAPAAQRPAQTQTPAANGQTTDAPARAPRNKSDKHWVYFAISDQQSKGLREMARLAGGKAQDFYRDLLSPAIDKAIADFDENREVVAARAKAQAAKTAAERAVEIARKAQEDLAKVESANKS